MILEIEQVNSYDDNASYIVILCHSGVFWDIQCGGMSCLHEHPQGIALSIYPIDFDDCSYGCSNLDRDTPAMVKARERLANDLKKFFESSPIYSRIKFDFSRIRGLKEGYWPIEYNICDDVWKKAVLHAGNCD